MDTDRADSAGGLPSGHGKPQSKVNVLVVGDEVGIETIDRLPRGTPKRTCSALRPGEPKPCGDSRRERLAVEAREPGERRVDDQTEAVDHFAGRLDDQGRNRSNGRVCTEGRHHLPHRVSFKLNVVVEQNDELASPCVHTGIDCIGKAAVDLQGHDGHLRPLTGEPLSGVVGGGVVDDDHAVRFGLGGEAREAAGGQRVVPVNGDDDINLLSGGGHRRGVCQLRAR
nr:hypothetical protein [Conexibacter sp. DBS9H8]